MKHLLSILALLIIGLTLFTACSSDNDLPPRVPASVRGTYTDFRDGNTYRWVRYGKLDWMSDNFRYDLKDEDSSVVYHDANDKPIDATRYGLLYSYSGAVAACPDGWRIPTDADWQQLETALGMSQADAGRRDWRGNIAQSMVTAYGDSCDLNLILGGFYTKLTIMGGSGFRHIGVFAWYWTSSVDTEKGNSYYFYRKFMANKVGVYRESMITDKQFLSVRYVRDAQ